MNKGELISAMAEAAGINKSQASDALDAFISNTTNCLKGGDKLTLIGFGTFSTAHREARKGRNPKNGETIDIPAKTVVKFKPGKDLSETVDA